MLQITNINSELVPKCLTDTQFAKRSIPPNMKYYHSIHYYA
jgi:hypothetical protein